MAPESPGFPLVILGLNTEPEDDAERVRILGPVRKAPYSNPFCIGPVMASWMRSSAASSSNVSSALP